MRYLKLQQLIKPSFGSISICGCSLGDSRKENLLDSYDKDGTTRTDRNYNLYANLQLGELGFSGGFIRLEYDTQDKLSRVVLTASYSVPYTRRLSYIQILIEYLNDSEYYDSILEESSFCFRNALNELIIQFYDQEIVIELYSSSASGKEPGEHFESGALKTVSMLSKGKKDGWEDYCEKKRNEDIRARFNVVQRPVKKSVPQEDVDAFIKESSEALDAKSVWITFIELFYNDKPRLLNVLRNANVVKKEDGGYEVCIVVMNESQKHWIEEKLMKELTEELNKLKIFSDGNVICSVVVSEK